MNQIFSSFRAEILKTKRTFALWLTILGAFFIPMIYFLIIVNRPERFIPKDPSKTNIWNGYFENAWQSISFMLLPFFVVLLTTLVIQIEHKSNTWKHLLTLPVPKWVVYLNKLLIIIFLVALCYILFIIFLLIGGYILGIIHPKLPFHSQEIPLTYIINFTLKSFASVLGLIAIHYWIAIRIKNLILPISIGLVGIIAGMILAQGWEKIIYFPHAYTVLTFFEMTKGAFSSLAKHEIYSILYFFGITILGFFDFKYKFKS